MNRFLFAFFLSTAIVCADELKTIVLQEKSNSLKEFIIQYTLVENYGLELAKAKQLVYKEKPISQLNFSFTPKTLWVRFQVENTAMKHPYLVIENPLLEYLDIWIFEKEKLITSFQLGNRFPFLNRVIRARDFAAPLQLEKDKKYEIYIQTKSKDVLKMPIHFEPEVEFQISYTNKSTLLGIYYGSILVMILYNLFLYIYLRVRIFLYYTFFLFFAFAFASSQNGIAYEYFWPNATNFVYLANPILCAFYIGSFVIFSREYLNLKYHPRINSISKIVAAIAFAFAILAFVLDYQTIVYLNTALGLIGLLFCFAFGVYSLQLKYPMAKFYLLGFSSFFMGAIFYALQDLAWIPSNDFTVYAMQIGSGIEMVLFSLGLAFRMKLVEDKKRQAEENLKTRTMFLANMSHEIRTPMNGILGSVDFLKQTNLDLHQKQYVEILEKTGNLLLNLINDILDLSKLESGKIALERSSNSLKSLIFDLSEFYSAMKGKPNVKFRFEVPKNIAEYYLYDEFRLKQVFHNLLGNAYKFTEQGTIGFYVKVLEDHDTFTRFEIKITDTGIGMDPETVQNLFQPFSQADSSFSRKFGGTGLGLFISKRLIEEMDGSIAVESHKRKGTTFAVELGFEKTNMPAKISRAEGLQLHPNTTQLKILIAEDNEINQILISKLFHSFKVSFDLANNGREALELFVENKNYNAIFLDIQMPELDGLKTCKIIRENYSQTIPIFALTAHVLEEEREQGLKEGFNEYLYKPLEKEKIIAVLNSLVKA